MLGPGFIICFAFRFKNFICMSIFPVCMSVHRVCAVPAGARKEHQIAWNWSYRLLFVTIWGLGTNPRPLKE